MNPILQSLGFGPSDRVVITHADDVGMCHATVDAFEALARIGTLRSGAVMVPCPWFPLAADLQRKNPSFDLGVHLTLTSEFRHYRWRPLSVGAGSGLVDGEGFFPRTIREVQERAEPGEVAAELETQVGRAFDFGMDATHVDMHMGALAHGKFLPAYLAVARHWGLPAFLPAGDRGVFAAFGMPEGCFESVEALLPSAGDFPRIDAGVSLPLRGSGDQVEIAKRLLGETRPGLTHFILHPAVDTPELRALAPDWEGRVGNFNALASPDFEKHLEREGIHLIGYREIRDAMRRGASIRSPVELQSSVVEGSGTPRRHAPRPGSEGP